MRNIHLTKEPVTLTGFQAILKPSKFGYSLKALVGQDIVEALEKDTPGVVLIYDEIYKGIEKTYAVPV